MYVDTGGIECILQAIASFAGRRWATIDRGKMDDIVCFSLHPRLDHGATSFSLKGCRSTVLLTRFGSDAQNRPFHVLSVRGGVALQRRVDVFPREISLHPRSQTDRLVVSRFDRKPVTSILFRARMSVDTLLNRRRHLRR
jgi:hypothetical protein